MKFARSAIAAAAALTSLSALAAFPPAAPQGTFYFTGVCADCTPVGSPATAVLFIGASGGTFSFQSSNQSLAGFIEAAYLGAIDAEGNANSFVFFFPPAPTAATTTNNILEGWSFKSYTDGSWELGEGFLPPDDKDFGTQGVWSTRPPVPEPATYGLMALGLAGLALVRRRRSAAQA